MSLWKKKYYKRTGELLTFDAAIHLYSPPSLVWMLEIFRCETTSPLTVTYCPTCNLSVFDSRFPSSSQVISGVGFPLATHFKNMLGPGWRVSSAKAWRIWGGSTVDNQRDRRIISLTRTHIYTYTIIISFIFARSIFLIGSLRFNYKSIASMRIMLITSKKSFY